MCILELSSQFHSDEDTVCVYSLSEEDTVCVYSRTQFSVLSQVLVRRTRFVCILDLSSQCLSEEDTVCVYSRTQFSVS